MIILLYILLLYDTIKYKINTVLQLERVIASGLVEYMVLYGTHLTHRPYLSNNFSASDRTKKCEPVLRFLFKIQIKIITCENYRNKY